MYAKRALLTPRGRTAPATWDLTVVTTAVNQTYTIDINAGTTPSILIDWGDGYSETYTTTGQKTRTYAASGTYTVKLSGSFSSGGNIRFGSNAADRARLKATGDVPFIPGLLNFRETFSECTGLAGSIPANLFRYNPQITDQAFHYTFYGCTGITGSIPADLFRYNTNVSSSAFDRTFAGCTGLTGSIPADLFRYNTKVSGTGFALAFATCPGLTGSIPADLFRYCPLPGVFGFQGTFYNCTGLTGAIPADLFRYNVNVGTNAFRETFRGCTGLTGSIPDGLFRYNINAVTDAFYGTFQGCNSLELSPYIFFAEGEESTRFLNQSPGFTNCFYRTGAYTVTQGTAPALWDCDYGTGTPVTTDCFQGHSTDSVSNWADIPAAWT